MTENTAGDPEHDEMRVSVTVPVNPATPDARPRLDAGQMWAGLLRKAENAVPFIEPMTSCTVLERHRQGLLREVVVHGERLRERVVFEPERRVSFLRQDERATWQIHNEIGHDPAGELVLTFTAVLPAGAADVDATRASLEQAALTTVAVIRRFTAVPAA